jgi:hypothetical protein
MAIAGRERDVFRDGVEEGLQRAAFDDDAFRAAGGAGGVEDVRGVPVVAALLRFFCAAVEWAVDDERGLRVGEHVVEACARELGIEREVSRAGFEDTEDGGDHVDGAFERDGDEVFRADAARDEVVGDAVCARAQMGVAERAGVGGVLAAVAGWRLGGVNRSLAYSSTPSMPPGVPSGSRRSTSPTDRSNFALAVAIGCGVTAAPAAPASPAPASPASNASITWNSGCRDSDRAGFSTSTSRSNGSSWWP